MSVDTLFDYLESAEGSEDLDALMAGELNTVNIRELCENHGLKERAVISLSKVSIRSYRQRKQEMRRARAAGRSY